MRIMGFIFFFLIYENHQNGVFFEFEKFSKKIFKNKTQSAQHKLAQQTNLQKIEELKKVKQELKSIEEKNETKRKYLMEKVRVIERTRNENQSKNNDVDKFF